MKRALRSSAGLRRNPHPNPARDSSPKPTPCTTKTSPPARPWAHSAALCCRMKAACSPTATPALSPPAATAPRSASSAPPSSRASSIHVYADETRPFLQGARLTAWELMADGIPTTVICDNMAASLMRAGTHPGRRRRRRPHRRQRRLRQQDRHLQRRHPRQRARHPVLRAPPPGPPSTLATATGDAIPIEERSPSKSRTTAASSSLPTASASATPPSTSLPRKYVTAIITERGVLRAPYTESLREMELAAK